MLTFEKIPVDDVAIKVPPQEPAYNSIERQFLNYLHLQLINGSRTADWVTMKYDVGSDEEFECNGG